MTRIAVFPGSFDPFTRGHEDIVRRAIPLFDEIIIALGVNTNKRYMFQTESRVKHIQSIFSDDTSVRIMSYEGLTIDFCRENKAGYLIRGLRNTNDFEFEKAIAFMNDDLATAHGGAIETIFLMTDKVYTGISSTIVREIKKNQGDISRFVTNEEHLIINT